MELDTSLLKHARGNVLHLAYAQKADLIFYHGFWQKDDWWRHEVGPSFFFLKCLTLKNVSGFPVKATYNLPYI